MKRFLQFIFVFLLIGLFLFPSLAKEGLGEVGLSIQKAQAQNIGSLDNIVTSGFSFRKDLQLGDTDPDVRELQKVLNADIDTYVASEGPGSRGSESTYFGDLTKQAVIRFQNKYRDTILTPSGLTTGNGNVGRSTRTKLNLLIGVINTTDSIGLPQIRAGSAVAPVTTYVPPAVAPVMQTNPGISICQFINILATLPTIEASRINQAKITFNCNVSNPVPMVDIKVNGQNGPIQLNSPQTVSISWISANVTACANSKGTKPISGTDSFYINKSGTAGISCSGPNGTVSDSVLIRLVSADEDEDNEVQKPVLLETSSYSFLPTSATFDLKTDVPTKAVITYRPSNSTNKQTLTYNSLRSSRSEVITGLTPNTFYVFTIRITNADGNYYLSPEFEVQTPAEIIPPDSINEFESLQVDCLANPNPAVVDSDVIWTVNPIGGTGVYTYNWSSLDGLSGTNKFVNKIYNTIGLKTSMVTVNSGLQSASSTCNVTVNATTTEDVETLNIYCEPDNSSVILGTPVTWAVFASGGTGSYRYSWSGTDGLSGSRATVSKTYSSAGEKTAKVKVSSGSGNNIINKTAECEAEVTEEEEVAGPERHFYFAGQVTQILTCQSGTTQVVLTPCSGQALSSNYVTGASNAYGTGYIVIREGMQTVPAVGQTVMGTAVDDMGLTCPGASASYIGTVTGNMQTGSSCTATATNSNSASTGSEIGSDVGEEVGGFYGGNIGATVGGILLSEVPVVGTFVGTVVGRYVGNYVGELVGGSVGEAIGDAVSDVGDAVADVFGW